MHFNNPKVKHFLIVIKNYHFYHNWGYAFRASVCNPKIAWKLPQTKNNTNISQKLILQLTLPPPPPLEYTFTLPHDLYLSSLNSQRFSGYRRDQMDRKTDKQTDIILLCIIDRMYVKNTSKYFIEMFCYNYLMAYWNTFFLIYC